MLSNRLGPFVSNSVRGVGASVKFNDGQPLNKAPLFSGSDVTGADTSSPLSQVPSEPPQQPIAPVEIVSLKMAKLLSGLYGKVSGFELLQAIDSETRQSPIAWDDLAEKLAVQAGELEPVALRGFLVRLQKAGLITQQEGQVRLLPMAEGILKRAEQVEANGALAASYFRETWMAPSVIGTLETLKMYMSMHRQHLVNTVHPLEEEKMQHRAGYLQHQNDSRNMKSALREAKADSSIPKRMAQKLRREAKDSRIKALVSLMKAKKVGKKLRQEKETFQEHRNDLNSLFQSAKIAFQKALQICAIPIRVDGEKQTLFQVGPDVFQPSQDGHLKPVVKTPEA